MTNAVDLLTKLPGGRRAADASEKVMDGVTHIVATIIRPAVLKVIAEQGAALHEDGSARASDAAAHKAKELDVDLAAVEGSGAQGMITAKDVMRSTPLS